MTGRGGGGLMAATLRRDLGLPAAVAVVVGSMIGVGIFLGPRVIAQYLPTPGLVMLVWILGGLFVFAGALTYAELGATLPESGGNYAFMRETYGPLPAYLTGWSGFAVGKAASVAALAVGFSEFLVAFFPVPRAGQLAVAALLVGLVSLVNIVGVRHAGRLAVVTGVVKVGAIAALVLGGLFLLGHGIPALASTPLLPSEFSLAALVSAFGLALIPVFFAYDGWVNSTQVAEEVKDPSRNVPRSLILGTLLVVAAYALVNLTYLLALGPENVGVSGAAAETARVMAGGPGAALIGIAILISIVGTVNAVTLSGPRIAFAMSRDGLFFRDIDRVSRWGTPAKAIVLQGVIAIALVLMPPFGGAPLFDTLLTYIIVDSFLFYGLGAASVFILRRKRPDAPRPFKVPFYPWVPGIFVAGSALFLVNAFLRTPVDAIVGVLIVLAGLPGYYYWSRKNAARKVRRISYAFREEPAPADEPA